MASTQLLSPFPSCRTVKELAGSGTLDSVPSQYRLPTAESPSDLEPSLSLQIPTIDFSKLAGGSPEQRSQIVRDLGRACRDWGFFVVANHGVPERVMGSVVEMVRRFFDLTEEEKREYSGTHVLDPIRCGTSFNPTVEDVNYWRDYLKLIVHPLFHSPSKPDGFREALLEYSTCIREVARGLLKGINESLGLEEGYMDRVLELDSSLQILAANFYPPCPQPELAMGMPPHSDHGLLTVLMQNGTDGLQVKHGDNWVEVKPSPGCLLVNTGDHIEIISNGKYKSVIHRAVLNNERMRISVAIVHGPSSEVVVVPAPQMVGLEAQRSTYRGMKYTDYLELQQSNQLKGKSALDLVRMPEM